MHDIQRAGNPPLMKNSGGYTVEGMQVEREDVEWYGLERFSVTECQEKGWKHIILKDLDLTNIDGMSEEEVKRVSRAAFAFQDDAHGTRNATIAPNSWRRCLEFWTRALLDWIYVCH